MACEPSKRPSLIVAPFDARTAEKHQQKWAQYLGAPVRTTNSIGMKLMLIPAGEFMMGSPDSEKGRAKDEHQHAVRITKPFYLSACEVTQEEYQRVMGRNPSFFSPSVDFGEQVSGRDTRRFPVENVTWQNAVEFCQKLSSLAEEKRASHVYRLPTEAEWEYTCRAGTTTPFHFGFQLNGRDANCNGDYPYGTEMKGPNLMRTTKVGSYPPNAFGLYDMHGNVWEWCQDWYGYDYYWESPVVDPQGPSSEAADRVIRGGGWSNAADRGCRAAGRSRIEPRDRFDYLGFRVVAVSPSK
jgi:formylglycine-generating enzyme required for sulfatase activity